MTRTIKFNLHLNEYTKNIILKRQHYFSYFFRKLYKHIHLIDDKEFITKLCGIYSISAYESNCIKMDVRTKYNQVQATKDNLCKDILVLTKQIKELKCKTRTKKETYKLFKLENKLSYKNKSLSKDITFGSRTLLKHITHLYNNKHNGLDYSTLEDKLKEYHDNRILPLSYYGSKHEKDSNRFFNFDFINNEIRYKIGKEKIKLNYTVSNNYKKELLELQKIKDLKLTPLTVTLTSEYLCLSYDMSDLLGEQFDYASYKEEIKRVNNGKYDKTIWSKYKQEQESRKLIGKNRFRGFSLDFNPCYIGIAIQDRKGDETKLIYSQCFDLSELVKKSSKASYDVESKYLTNKRNFEIAEIYKKIFKLIQHYKCGYFIMEDLDFKSNSTEEFSREANRKIKNCWNLQFQLRLLDKYCLLQDLVMVKVNPCYTSFIGNIMNPTFDPIAAAIEIGRRGLFKYEKGNNFYPTLSDTILDTVVERFKETLPDVQAIKDCKTWVNLYKLFKQTGVRYRWQLDENHYNCLRKNNTKTKWKVYIF